MLGIIAQRGRQFQPRFPVRRGGIPTAPPLLSHPSALCAHLDARVLRRQGDSLPHSLANLVTIAPEMLDQTLVSERCFRGTPPVSAFSHPRRPLIPRVCMQSPTTASVPLVARALLWALTIPFVGAHLEPILRLPTSLLLQSVHNALQGTGVQGLSRLSAGRARLAITAHSAAKCPLHPPVLQDISLLQRLSQLHHSATYVVLETFVFKPAPPHPLAPLGRTPIRQRPLPMLHAWRVRWATAVLSSQAIQFHVVQAITREFLPHLARFALADRSALQIVRLLYRFVGPIVARQAFSAKRGCLTSQNTRRMPVGQEHTAHLALHFRCPALLERTIHHPDSRPRKAVFGALQALIA